jgi:hypothetical protein
MGVLSWQDFQVYKVLLGLNRFVSLLSFSLGDIGKLACPLKSKIIG